MAISTRITRFNMHQLPPYERLQHQRARRAEAAAEAQKYTNMANSFAAIQRANAIEMGNIVSKVAMNRIYKKA